MTTNRIHIAGACLVLSVLLAGCSLLEAEESEESSLATTSVDPADFRIKTDQTVYQPDSENYIEIEYTLYNETGQTLYITDERGQLLAEMYKNVSSDEWTFAFGFTVPDILASPIKLPPGESYTQQLRIPLPVGDISVWRIANNEIEGTFRIQEKIYSRWDQETLSGDLLPEERRTSNSFEIRR